MRALCPVRRLNNVVLPVFGLPARTTTGLSVDTAATEGFATGRAVVTWCSARDSERVPDPGRWSRRLESRARPLGLHGRALHPPRRDVSRGSRLGPTARWDPRAEPLAGLRRGFRVRVRAP